MTGQIAIGAVGLLLVSAMVYGVGIASARYKISDVGAWLSATTKGMVVHANGLVGKVDGKANLGATARGHRIKIIQDGGTVLLVDETTGAVSRVDPSQLKVEQTVNLGLKVQIVANADVAYTVDQYKGVVQQIDPVKLTAVGKATSVEPPVGLAGLDARGTLWVPSPQTGQLIPFQNGVQGAPVAVAAPRDQLQLSIVAGVPTVLDLTTGTAAIVGGDGVRKINLPPTLGRAVKAPEVVEGQNLPILGAKGALTLLDTGTGALTNISLRLPQRAALQEPQILGSKVYIPDASAGSLIVYDYISGKIERQISVSGMPGPLDVFVKDGILWANDPNRDAAVSVGQDGVPKPFRKYDTKAPGGVRKPIPTEKPGGGNGRDPGNGGNRPQQPQQPPPPKPKPNDPPTEPTDVRATGDQGTVTITFGQSSYNRIQPKSYVLATGQGQPVPNAQPGPEIAQGSGEYKFTVAGLACGRNYTFRVAVKFQDPKSRQIRTGRYGQDTTPACEVPQAPQAQSATGNNGTITVTFAPGTDTSSVKDYILTDTGGAQIPGTSPVTPTAQPRFVLRNVPCDKSYEYKVAARYTDKGQAAQALSSNSVSTFSCQATGPASGLTADPVNHGANLKWTKAAGYDVTYTVSWPSGSKTTTDTSFSVTGLSNGSTHQLTVTAKNGAGTANGTSVSVNLDPAPHAQTLNGHHNDNTNTWLHTSPSTDTSTRDGQFPQGFTGAVSVICQQTGPSITDTNNSSLVSNVWDKISYGGRDRWVSDIYVTSANSGSNNFSPPLWECT
ncbi:fibronectin type III domain-containing protein [Actinomadura barringtoniae]|uniref:Fibronectin type III domain-containing protein n=1 Tax=Actinomadura barringtoniae TaxID=1427535 RepID=A0A939PKF6_9ACTN|nr:fibronectin type III domain-containing protein [Actinomadura barringtoniae]MBO2453763.1 fibronectin type III domain-containing protein [Actinomadura barringtoniae]